MSSGQVGESTPVGEASIGAGGIIGILFILVLVLLITALLLYCRLARRKTPCDLFHRYVRPCQSTEKGGDRNNVAVQLVVHSYCALICIYRLLGLRAEDFLLNICKIFNKCYVNVSHSIYKCFAEVVDSTFILFMMISIQEIQ